MYLLTTLFFLASAVFADTECPNVVAFGDRRKDKNTLRIAQYNVEWLYIDYYASADCPGNGCPWHNQDEAQTHLNYVSQVLKDLDPDIINLCEVEGCDELTMVKNKLNDTTYNPYLKKGTDSATGQNVGMLTRVDPLVSLYRSEEKVAYPIANSKCGNTTASGTSGVSKHYITEFYFGNMNVALIGAHLLAIPTDPSRCVQREAQAQVLQNIVSSYINKNYEIILLGDMNDFDAEVLDINSDKPISRVLDILKGLDGEKKGSYQLTNVAYRVSQKQRYSDWWDSDNDCETSSQKDYSMIDHILVTPKIDKTIVNAYMFHGYNIYCGTWNSDHYPVIIDLQF